MTQALKIDKNLDKHLKVLKSEEGEASSLEVSSYDNGAKITGDLEVTGYTDNIRLRDESVIKSDGNLTLRSDGDIKIRVDGGQLTLVDDGDAVDPDFIIKGTCDTTIGPTIQFQQIRNDSDAGQDDDILGLIQFYGNNAAPELCEFARISASIESVTDGTELGKLRLNVLTKEPVDLNSSTISGLVLTGSSTTSEIDVTIANGAASLTTIAGDLDIDGDLITTAGNITLDSGGTISLDSHSGNFIAAKAGTEFSAANSAYAGMILGYTDIGLNEADTIQNLTTSYAVPTDEFSVSFVAPPSGNVEIFFQIGWDAGTGNAGDCYAGLSTASRTSGYSALSAIPEVELMDGMSRGALRTIRHSWTITGLTAGTSTEYWIGFKTSNTLGNPHIQWGSNATGEYPDFIMKATALPATITT